MSIASAHSCVRENSGICWGWIRENWASVLWPALRQHIVLTVIAINFIGDGLRDALDPRSRE